MAKVLTIEDEENLRFSIRRTLARAGHEVSEAACLRDARSLLKNAEFDLVLTDVMLGAETGLDLVRELRSDGYDGVIVVMTAFGTVQSAVAAMKEGADDYLQKPLSMEELSIQVDRLLEHRRVARRLKLYERLEMTREGPQDVLGESQAWRATLSLADRLASIPISAPLPGEGGGLPAILLLGETGVGKGVMARFIHARANAHAAGVSAGRVEGAAGGVGGGRRGGHAGGAASQAPFVHVNCSALPATLVEGELFGHEKGAFTDAREARQGLFEMAEGGTIFLDEVSEMPVDLQAKLLLVVEQGTFRRVGGSRERTVRARVIAASNQDLEKRVEVGAFRRDLFYRLNAFTVRIPSLRERGEDAGLIAEAMLGRLTRRYARPRMALSPAARAAIIHHPWPGNVRELVNAVQRAVMLCDGPEIGPADLGLGAPAPPPPSPLLAAVPQHGAPPPPTAFPGGHPGAAAHAPPHPAPDGAASLVFDFDAGVHTADEVEKTLIMQALQRTKGNVSRAAKLIGMQRSSLRYRIERYALEPFVLEVTNQ